MTKTKKNLAILIFSFLLLGIYGHELRPAKDYEIATINAKKEIAKEVKMTDWVLNEFEINGLNKYVAFCVIMTESKFNPDAISPTQDYGLMQWNIQHIRSGFISLNCASDYKCAVKKAIEKVKKDKNWNSWYGYKNGNCGLFGKVFN